MSSAFVTLKMENKNNTRSPSIIDSIALCGLHLVGVFYRHFIISKIFFLRFKRYKRLNADWFVIQYKNSSYIVQLQWCGQEQYDLF